MKAKVRTVGHLCYGIMEGKDPNHKRRWVGYITPIIYDDPCMAWQLVESAWALLYRGEHRHLWTEDRNLYDNLRGQADAMLAGHMMHCDKVMEAPRN